jgi:glycine betaine/proline transport system ATP-binding protein
MTQSPKIACRNVWKVFGHDPKGFLARHGGAPSEAQLREHHYVCAVRDVSFDVFPGEILIVMGLSGSGKSTLIRALSRLNDPTAGEILLDGQDLLKVSASELVELRRHKMGMVFQHFGLLPHRNVIDNIAFPLEIRGTSRDQREARALEMLKLVGLEGRETHFPRELSGGQQQRVGIARSLAVGPDIWFLDEPFSALDPLIRREMQDEFVRLQTILKKTIVFITHDFDEAVRLGDRIAIMNEGRIVQIATAEEMISNPVDDYVRQFTRHAPRHRVISVGAIASTDIVSGGATSIRASTKLEDAAAMVLSSDAQFSVTDDDNRAIGSVIRAMMIAALYPGNGP